MPDEERKPGPYNYCDYRCDKCEFKDECTVYADELETQEEGKETKEQYIIPVLLSDAFSDLDWYKTLIPVKMQRTLNSFMQFALLDREYPEFSLEDAYHTSEVVYKALRS